MEQPRKRGSGSIINKAGTNLLYIRYYSTVNGKRVQQEEATGSDDPKVAEKMLRERIVDVSRGAVAPSDINRLRYEDIKETYLKDKPEQENYPGMKHLDSFFEGVKVSHIDINKIREFIDYRRDEDDAADPTIRRNLVVLRAMFNLAMKEGKLGLRDIPYFPMPKDSDAAGEYIEPEQFSEVLKHLPENLRPFFTFMYATGCRLGALKKITWEMVNKNCTIINLPGSITKNKQPLPISLAGPVLEPVAAMLRKLFRDDSKPVFDFTNFRPEWSKACAKAGIGTYDKKTRTRTGVRIHDCRCSAAINLLDSGVPEGTVLKIGGWKTRAMLDRYNVQNEKRIRTAMEQGGEFVAARMNGKA